jgi:hypothetical protein
VRRLLLAGVLLLTGCSAGEEAPAPAAVDGEAISGVVLWEYEAPDHDAQDITYQMRPPVHGPHWVPRDDEGRLGWLDCGVYDAPVPEEFAVHSLEHGAVWLTHLPDADDATVDALAALAGLDPDYVLVSPYPGQAGPVVASAWDAQLVVDDVDDPRLEQFVRAFVRNDRGREQGAPCAGGTDADTARAAVAAAPDRDEPVRRRTPTG